MTETTLSSRSTLSIGILGAGNVARALGTRWAATGHSVTVGGRTLSRARTLASDLGNGASGGSLVEAARGADVVLLAVPWDGVDDVLTQVEAHNGALAGVTVIDPTNPVNHGVGAHLLDQGSAAEYVASRAPGAHVVKAFNVHPAATWERARAEDVVTLAGDDPASLDVVRGLVRTVGATPHVIGGLDRARQVEELAGTVIALAFAGVDPGSAVPSAG